MKRFDRRVLAIALLPLIVACNPTAGGKPGAAESGVETRRAPDVFDQIERASKRFLDDQTTTRTEGLVAEGEAAGRAVVAEYVNDAKQAAQTQIGDAAGSAGNGALDGAVDALQERFSPND